MKTKVSEYELGNVKIFHIKETALNNLNIDNILPGLNSPNKPKISRNTANSE